MVDPSPPVLVLGAGINGAAPARELCLGGIGTCIVDTGDIARGATSYSSRLIHGGLRYLEYGELDLVRESLTERRRLLKLAAHHVRPLAISIPVSRRISGLRSAAGKMFGFKGGQGQEPRGLWLVRAGLGLYDRLARDTRLPRYTIQATSHMVDPPVDPMRFRWLCTYHDAQVVFPERLTVSLMDDARRIAEQQGVDWSLYTYHRVTMRGDTALVEPIGGGAPVKELKPRAIVNATGAWVDRTLADLGVPSDPLMGGTKGSHLLVAKPTLQERLNGHGLYIEAADGRPVFVLPFGRWLLVGTTDEPFQGDPATAVASSEEIDYLLSAVNQVMQGVNLSRQDVVMHYCGVRPLPRVTAASTAAITRRHALIRHRSHPVPIFSIVGGKLTTCRSLAETACRTLRRELSLPDGPTSESRSVPGSHSYPETVRARDDLIAALAARFRLETRHALAVWELLGTQAEEALAQSFGAARESSDPVAEIDGTDLPRELVRWVIRQEWVRTLEDLVERRLMLLYDQRLSQTTLALLADLLVQEGRLDLAQAPSAVQSAIDRFANHFARNVPP